MSNVPKLDDVAQKNADEIVNKEKAAKALSERKKVLNTAIRDFREHFVKVSKQAEGGDHIAVKQATYELPVLNLLHAMTHDFPLKDE